MMLTLRPLERADLPRLVEWRNAPDTRSGLRTPILLNTAMQSDWFDRVVCDRRATDRYWMAGDAAAVGLTGIQWENGLAEVSLLTDPSKPRQGIGSAALRAVLAEGFGRMRLLTIFGECYTHNPALGFWMRKVCEYEADVVFLPRRKFWGGTLHDAMVFTFTVEQWRARS